MASEQLKGDRKFVIEVVLKQPIALQHATEELKGDRSGSGDRLWHKNGDGA